MSATLSSNLQSILDNRLRYLPEITARAINSIDWSAKLITIGHKYGLHIDEMEEFQGVVLKAMIGLVAPTDFENQLINALALSPTNTDKIIAEVNREIFEPIHGFVMNQGRPADPMATAGIVVQPEASVPIPVKVSSVPLEIPPSPEPSKTIAKDHDKFDEFFMVK